MPEPSSPFLAAQWVWTPGPARRNHLAVFARTVPCAPSSVARVTVCASYHYELYADGRLLGRGPVHGDPTWCHYDRYVVTAGPDAESIDLAVLVRHSHGTQLHYLLPAPPGLICEAEVDGQVVVSTDATWKCRDLEMWADGTPERGWALDFCEDYDARREPDGWRPAPRFTEAQTADWPAAVPVPNADTIWSGWEPRPVPMGVTGEATTAQRFRAWTAGAAAPDDIGLASRHADEEPLDAVAAAAAGANAFTFDIGREWVGHPYLEIDAPAGVTVELSAAELLQPGTERPWIFRKGTRYTARFHTREGVNRLRWFAYTGCRYLHAVIRPSAEGVTIREAGVELRAAPLAWRAGNVAAGDPDLARILDICRHTLEQSAQEHLIDCPTREQTQYWGDGVFIAQSYAAAFGEPAYLRWYLDCFLHAPLNDDGQLSGKYPGASATLLDYSLIPLLGQVYHRRNAGAYYRAAETAEKALRLKAWYDRHAGPDGLVTFDFGDYFQRRLINFIDHPGIGWHDFPHPGIDRDGTSCPLNAFFYGFLRVLADLCRDCGRGADAAALDAQAGRLGDALRRTFWDAGAGLFRDAVKDGALSEGASWQTNCLMVFFDLVRGEPAAELLRTMLEGYDRLCRCSPYFHFYLLPALRKAGLEREALDLVRREWRPMLDAGATTAWEGFLGDAKDSLCHPWSTAPLLFLLEAEPFALPDGRPR